MSGNLSTTARVYVWGVVAAGLTAVTAAGYEMYVSPVGHQWFILAALTVVSGSATVKLPSVPAALTVSETFVFTSVLLFGAPAGTLTVALDGLIFSLWSEKQRKAPHRLLFNVAAPALSIWTSAKVFFIVAGIPPLVYQHSSISVFLFPLAIFTVLYFSLNSWLIAWAVALETSQAASQIWRQNFLWVSLNFFCGASVAALLTVYPSKPTGDLTFLTYLGAVLPLLLVLYLTYRTSMGRVEDANRHLAEINEMYLSTIETLAMAVDAKDQVTHGHIRRVQSYAINLAKALGIRDTGLLKAIEAASLLHDMGKLAVPEHILNKPGKLTLAEFEKMKLHASIGADILSAIHFPYPVIPMVRHHHENWDGTGYPDGLCRTDIPIGARILSVVDCFDALTSDRPYRPRLPDHEAIAILLQRRGTMYDPLVVDTFIHVHQTVAATDRFAGHEPPFALVELTRSIGDNRATADPMAGGDSAWGRTANVIAMSRLTASLAGIVSLDDAMSILSKHVRKLVAYDLCTLMTYKPATDQLHLAYADGVEVVSLRNWSTIVGQRLSGWVAASKQAALNSSPMLDFGELQNAALSSLRSALVVPVVHNSQLVGVMGFYSKTPDAYSTADRISAELIAGHIALVLSSGGQTIVSSLPSTQEVESRILNEFGDDPGGPRYAIILLRTLDAAIHAAVATTLMHGFLRTSDVVFSVSDSEVGCLLNRANEDSAARVVSRLMVDLTVLSDGVNQTTLSMVVVPDEAETLGQAVVLAQSKIGTRQTAA